MLTAETYYTAWLVYGVATLTALLVLNHWMRGGVSVVARKMLLLPLGGMALAPASPVISGETFAPAAIVAVFNYLTDGFGASLPALRALIGGLLLGVVLALLPPALGEGVGEERRGATRRR